MKNRLRVATTPLMAVLALAAFACENTTTTSPGPSELTPVPSLTSESPQPPVSSVSPPPSLKFEGVNNVLSGLVATDNLNFETCEGVLGEPPPGLTKTTIEFPQSVGDHPPAGLVTMCVTSFLSLDSTKAATVAASVWESIAAADSRFQTMMDSVRASTSGRPEEVHLGNRSFKLEANRDGVGSFVVFLDGVNLIQISTAMPDEEDPLFNLQQLEELAATIYSKLR